MSDRMAYEVELDNAAERLQRVLPIGEVKAIGRLEVVAALDQLLDELRDILAYFDVEADCKATLHPVNRPHLTKERLSQVYRWLRLCELRRETTR